MTKTYQEIKNAHEKAINEILKKNEIFWAFNDKQFKEGMEKIHETDIKKIADIGMGGFIKKENIDNYINEMETLDKSYKKELKEAKKAKEEAILYELRNHECFYTGSIEDVVEKFKGIYTKKDILKVYKNNNK